MLHEELRHLSLGFELWFSEDPQFVIVGRVRLRDGYNTQETQLLIEIPRDYPASPPGLGNSRVYVPVGLTYKGRQIMYAHQNTGPAFPTPGFGPWAWWCYEKIQWNPIYDTLTTFVEMMRADLTQPHLL